MKIKVTKTELDMLISEMIDNKGPVISEDVAAARATGLGKMNPAINAASKKAIKKGYPDKSDNFELMAGVFGVVSNFLEQVKDEDFADMGIQSFELADLLKKIKYLQGQMQKRLKAKIAAIDRKDQRSTVKGIKKQARADVAKARGKKTADQRKAARTTAKKAKLTTRQQKLQDKAASLSEKKHSLLNYLNEANNETVDDILLRAIAREASLKPGDIEGYIDVYNIYMEARATDKASPFLFYYVMNAACEVIGERYLSYITPNLDGFKELDVLKAAKFDAEYASSGIDILLAENDSNKAGVIFSGFGGNEKLDDDTRKLIDDLDSIIKNLLIIINESMKNHSRVGATKSQATSGLQATQADASIEDQADASIEQLKRDLAKTRERLKDGRKKARESNRKARQDNRQDRRKDRQKNRTQRKLDRVTRRIDKLDENESLSRGSLYRKRYYGRY